MKRFFQIAPLLLAGTVFPLWSVADKPYVQTEIQPRFRGGGLTVFREWSDREFTAQCLRFEPSFANMIACPPIPPRVVLSFCIDEQGRVDSVRVLQSPGADFSKHAIAVAESSPRWTPGQRLVRWEDGTFEWRPAPIRVVCPFVFRPMREIVDSLSNAGIARVAYFAGGAGLTFSEWIAAQVPEMARREDVACMTDTVGVRFKIDTTGKVFDVKIVESKYPGTARCAKRIVEASPLWLPALIDHRPVEEEHYVRVGFHSNEEDIFYAGEQMPTFRGGDLQSFRKWVENETIKQMAGAKTKNPGGRAILTFVIDEQGYLRNVEVLQPGNSVWTKAAVNVVRSSPRWEPGTIPTKPEWPCNCRVVRKPVKLKYTLPVRFPASGEKD